MTLESICAGIDRATHTIAWDIGIIVGEHAAGGRGTGVVGAGIIIVADKRRPAATSAGLARLAGQTSAGRTGGAVGRGGVLADAVYAGIDGAGIIIIAIRHITFGCIIRDAAGLVHRRAKIGCAGIGGAAAHAIGMKTGRTFAGECSGTVINTGRFIRG